MNDRVRGMAWLLALLLLLFAVDSASAQRIIWGIEEEFEDGQSISLNDDDDALKISTDPEPLPFVWVPQISYGTIARIDATTGEVVGEYLTFPSLPAAGFGNGSPFAVAVDKLGNCWVANRFGFDFCQKGGKIPSGSIVKLGVVIGGTRVDADGNPDENGEYLKPPFLYNTCVDRDGDNLIRTSRGLGNPLDWFGFDDVCGGVSAAEDEAILLHVRTEATFIETVAVDEDNNVWVAGDFGGFVDKVKLDGETGEFLAGVEAGCGGGGGVIDSFGTLWEGTLGSDNFNSRTDTETFLSECNFDPGCAYGVAVDSTRLTVWYTCDCCGGGVNLIEVDRDGNVLNTIPIDGFSRAGAVVVDQAGHIWTMERGQLGTGIAHFAPSPSTGNIIRVGTIDGLNGPDGISVDGFGYLWVPEAGTSNVLRVDPLGGPAGAEGIAVGAVDMVIPLRDGSAPSSFGDMTGLIALGATSSHNDGFWDVVFDSEQEGTPWGTVRWNKLEPLGTKVSVFVRASNDRLALPILPFVEVMNGEPFRGVNGRYIEVQAKLERFDNDETPVVFDITLEASECFLLIAGGVGEDPWRPGPLAHEFTTQLAGIEKWYPVLMESNPEVTIQLPGRDALTPAAGGPVGVTGKAKTPVLRRAVQVLMWNPGVFPENPEQYTRAMEIVIWSDGTVTSTQVGEGDGMECEVQVVRRTPSSVTIKVPFVVEGM